MEDLEGVLVILLEPPSETKLFQFHGEIYEKSAEMLNTNPLLMDLNPPPRNPGSAPVMVKDMCTKYHSFASGTVWLWITGSPNMTLAVDHGCKAIKQTIKMIL